MILKRAATICSLLIVFGALADGLRYSSPDPAVYHPLPESIPPKNPLARENPALLELNSSLLKDTTIIDFERRQIAFLKVADPGIVLWQYRYGELEEYIQNRWNYGFASQWYREYATGSSVRREEERKQLSLELKLPQHYYNQAIPPWAQRILGKEPPKLSIHGYEEIEFSLKSNNYDVPGEEESDGSLSPEFKNNYNLTVSGSVGKLINVQMSTSSEEDFALEDDLKDIKIEYKGDGDELEDDIIQEVSAGYTRFEIPRTALSGYSESREGLFGINVKSKFGPLLLTTVASHERGEALSEAFYPSKSESKSEGALDIQYSEYTYFFLDSLYREAYIDKYNMEKAQKASPPRVLDDYEVWVSVPSDEEKNASSDVGNTYRYVQGYGGALFRKLVEGYDLNQTEGWLWVADSLISPNEVVGVYFRTEDSTKISRKGDLTIVPGDTAATFKTIRDLFIIKPRTTEFDSTHPTFPLMWRNAYRIGVFDGDVEVKVGRIKEGTNDTLYRNEDNVLYSRILGLTDDNGKRIEDQNIFRLNEGYLVLPPFADQFFGNEPFRNPKLGEENTRTDMYRYRQNSSYYLNEIRPKPKFFIQITGTSTDRRTSKNLGFGVIEGSEEVTVNGERLVRNVDYRIFYDAGELELLSLKAQNATRIDIKYQRESLFIPESKTFLGARGEIRLPLISKNSFVGTSVLYQSSASSDDVPRIGQEPFNKLLLDINTSLDFEPEWMTSFVNALPLVETDAKSSLRIDVEAAHSKTISKTKGQAYIDDFESSEQVYPISSAHRLWHQSSPPEEFLSDFLNNPPVWDQWWFSPVEGDETWEAYYRRDNIIGLSDEEIDAYGERGLIEPVLLWQTQPTDPQRQLYPHYNNPWAGIMQWFPTTSVDRTDDRYLEFIVNVNSAPGTLHVDLGEISEDISLNGGPPNGKFDSENPRNIAVITDSLNTGLDGVFDSLEYYLHPNETQTGWDTLWPGDPLLPFPSDPHGDNYKPYEFDQGRTKNFRVANGKQDDYSRTIKLITSEDLNGDRFSTNESFFRFEIDLSDIKNSDYYDSTANTREDLGWYKVRIPLDQGTPYNNPGWDRIYYLRMWWDGFGERKSEEHTLAFARMQFVGNQWDAVVSSPDSQGVVEGPAVAVGVVNTEEDRDYLNAVDGRDFIQREKDSRGNFYKKEQALRIDYDSLSAGEAALARRRYDYQPLDISAYKHASLVVHSDADYRADSVYFVIRFGNDDSSFYEYRAPLDNGWSATDWAVPIEIDLSALAHTKRRLLEQFGEIDSLVDTVWNADPSGRSFYRIHTRLSRSPSYSQIKDIYLGLVRSDSSLTGPVSGELWINEFRVDGLEGFAGSAALANVQMQWADFMSLGGEVSYQDGNFRQMTETSITPGDSKVRGAANASIALDKFAPKEWGLDVPVDVKASRLVDRPQLRPGSDISLQGEDNEPDKLMDFLSDKDSSDAEHYQKVTTDLSISTRYRKNRDSKSIVGKLTADRISVNDLSYRTHLFTEHRGQNHETSGDYLKVDSSITYSGDLAYDLSPRVTPEWSTWRPFEKTPYNWFPNQLKRYELSLLPRRLSFDLAKVTYQKKFDRDERVSDSTNRVHTLDLRHGMNLSYSPISPLLDFNYDLSVTRDLGESTHDVDSLGGWGGFIQNRMLQRHDTWGEYLYMYGEKSRTQSARFDFKPKFFDWLDHTFDYKGVFNSEERTLDGNSYLNLEMSSEFEFQGAVQFSTLFDRLTDGTKSVESLSKGFDAIGKAFDKINLRRVSFNYDATLMTRYGNVRTNILDTSAIKRTDFLRYQLGFVKERSLRDIARGRIDPELFGGWEYRLEDDEYDAYRDDYVTGKRSWNFTTGFRFPDPIGIEFSRLSLKRSEDTRRIPDTTRYDSTTVWPEVGIGVKASFLNKLPVVNKNINNVSLSSDYTFRKSVEHHFTRRIDTSGYDSDSSRVVSHEFRPLVGFGGTLKKWPISMNFNRDFSQTETRANEGMRKVSETANRASLNWTLKPKFKRDEVKILGFEIPLTGTLRLDLDFSHRTSTEITAQDANEKGDPNWGDELKSVLWSLEPRASYDFSRNVTGKARYQYTSSKSNDETSDQTTHIFSLSVRISF